MVEIVLGSRTGRLRRIALLPLTGHDERAVGSSMGAQAGTELLGRLIDGDVWSMSLSDRDYLVAELYRVHFGDTVECRLRCTACGEGYDLAFSLSALMQSIYGDWGASAPVDGPDEHGVFSTPSARFRLPTTHDERYLWERPGTPPEQWLIERCLLEGQMEPSVLDALLSHVGPVLTTDLDLVCPHCEAEQVQTFDIVAYVLAAIDRERALLLREVHSIATTYGWNFDEIMGLQRNERRNFVGLIEASHGATEALS